MPIMIDQKFIEDIFNKYRNAILYLIIGLSAVVVDFATFALLVRVYDQGSYLSNLISIGVATVYSFILNAYFNFKKTDRMAVRFFSFTLASALGFTISSAILWINGETLGIDDVVVKGITLPVVVFSQYLFNKLITFK